MFGGNDNSIVQPNTGSQDTQADNPSGTTPNDPTTASTTPPAPSYDTSSYGADSTTPQPSVPSDAPDLDIPSPSLDTSSPTPAQPAGSEDLVDIKQQALQQLSPLVGHLDQNPEEKFRTLMMMIQASDDSSLIKDAYAAAQQLTDEKVRAQALLDVVNEINYFSQHQNQQ